MMADGAPEGSALSQATELNHTTQEDSPLTKTSSVVDSSKLPLKENLSQETKNGNSEVSSTENPIEIIDLDSNTSQPTPSKVSEVDEQTQSSVEMIHIPVVEPLITAGNLASLCLLSDGQENFGPKLTSQPTSPVRIEEPVEQKSSNPTEESKPAVQPSMSVNPLFLSARARKLLKLKQQAKENPQSSPSTASAESSTPNPIDPNASRAQVAMMEAFVQKPGPQVQEAKSVPGTTVSKEKKKEAAPKQKKKKEIVATNTISPFFNNSFPRVPNLESNPIFIQPQPKIFSSGTGEDLSPMVLEGSANLPSLEDKAVTDAGGEFVLDMDQYGQLLSVSEFLRLSATKVIEDWPSMLCDPKLLEKAICVPSSQYSHLFSFLVSFLLRCLKFHQTEDYDEVTNFIDIPKALSESLDISNFDFASSLPKDKLDVMSRLVDLITQQAWFIKHLESMSTLSTSLVQKKRDLSIKYDSLKITLKRFNDDLANAQRRHQFIEIQQLENPDGELIALQKDAVAKQIEEIESRFQMAKKSEEELSKEIKEVSLQEFGSADNALVHGQLRGAMGEAYAILLGKDRLGRYYWFWKCVGGILIESSSEALDNSGPAFPKWALVDDLSTLDTIVQSLNPKGVRECKLMINIDANKCKIIDSFPTCQKWKESRIKIADLTSESDALLKQISDEFASYSSTLCSQSTLSESLGCFNLHLRAFGLSELSELVHLYDISKHHTLKMETMKDRLRKIKSYLFDKSSVLVETADIIKTSQHLLNALESIVDLEQGVKFAHQIFDSTVPVLEEVKSLDLPLTKREKGLKSSLNILHTWIKTSPFFKDILTAATSSIEEKFPSIDFFCSWLQSIIDYLIDLHQEDIQDDAFIPLSQKKFQGMLLKQPCQYHNGESSLTDTYCHYHGISLPPMNFQSVFIPKSEKVFAGEVSSEESSSSDARSKSRPQRNRRQPASSTETTPRRSGRARNVVNYKIDMVIEESESPEDVPKRTPRRSNRAKSLDTSGSETNECTSTPNKRPLRSKSNNSRNMIDSESEDSLDEPPAKLQKSDLLKPTRSSKITDFVKVGRNGKGSSSNTPRKKTAKPDSDDEMESDPVTPRRTTPRKKIRIEESDEEGSEPIATRRAARTRKPVSYKLPEISQSEED